MSARRWLSRRVRTIVARSIARERSAIENPRAFHRMHYGYLLKAVLICILFALLLPSAQTTPWPIRAAVVLLIASTSFAAASAARRAAMAYFDGYIDGQAATVKNVHEALIRQMDLDDWLATERERQLVHLARRMNPDYRDREAS